MIVHHRLHNDTINYRYEGLDTIDYRSIRKIRYEGLDNMDNVILTIDELLAMFKTITIILAVSLQ
jgi:hypothetical protein